MSPRKSLAVNPLLERRGVWRWRFCAFDAAPETRGKRQNIGRAFFVAITFIPFGDFRIADKCNRHFRAWRCSSLRRISRQKLLAEADCAEPHFFLPVQNHSLLLS